jgi:hypothetical protein
MLQAQFDDGTGKIKSTVHAPSHQHKQNATFKHEDAAVLNFETPTDVFIRRSLWNLQCDTLMPFQEERRMVPK